MRNLDIRKYCLILVSLILIYYGVHAQSGAWVKKANLSTERAGASACVVDNKIYVIGGTADQTTVGTDVWEYNPAFHTDVATGNVSGTWIAAKSPYNIYGEITIPNDSTLTIEPGAEVVFMGHYKLNVQGRLLAVGTIKDSIRFTAEDKQTGWHGIRFMNTPNTNDTSKFIYCSFKYGKANTGAYNGDDRRGGAIFIRKYSNVIISHSLFESNMNEGDIVSATGGAVIYIDNADKPIVDNNTFINNNGTMDCSILTLYSNTIISNNKFLNNNGPHGPIFCINNSPLISGNFISNNNTTRAGGGIFCMTSSTIIMNNIIVNNKCFGLEGEGGGIKCWTNDKSKIINNTIGYNSGAHGGGICCNDNADPICANNIIWDNSSPNGSQVCLMDAQSDPTFVFNDIQGGKEGFAGSGAGNNFTGVYLMNLDADPLFVNKEINDFHLSDSSICIGAGSKDYCPTFDYEGCLRPNPEGSKPDIGAYEHVFGVPVPVTDVLQTQKNSLKYALYQNYPNPFNPTTVIHYELPQSSIVTLKIYDELGREVKTLVNQYQSKGKYDVNFNASDLASGIYIYRLKTGSIISSKKMILLK